jgi:cellulose synthase/poly-beta-1,6-N-acetylglucosamine synthase-like glycosyltransferase
LVFPMITIILSMGKKDKTETYWKDKALKNYDFANIITAYKNIDITKDLVHSLIQQPYQNHHIYLVADAADITDWDMQHEKLTILKPESALNLKIKSIIYAREHFIRPHDYTVIWDADNIAHFDFLNTINIYANAGCKAIQGQRTAKNLNTLIAAADALGEYYKNYIERQIPPLLGSSAVISGSGMAIEQQLFDTYIYGVAITKGKELGKKMMQEDKILQNHIIRARERIVFAKNAICFDEKISYAQQIETQRSRWLYSYFQNIPYSMGFILRGLLSVNWNMLFFGLITFAPPLFILLGLASIFSLIGLWVNIKLSLLLVFSILIFIGGIILSLKQSQAPPIVWQAIRVLPFFAFRQFLALFKMRNPEKHFGHTRHGD